MPDEFRFSPRPNRADRVAWRPWGAAALAEAASAGRPVLLSLTAFWCHWCHRMDETTYSDPVVIRLLNDELVPVRVDADRQPHVQDRYIAGGWPTTAFLTPTGEVLWSGTYVDAEQLRDVAAGVLAAWRDRRDELETEIERRRRALEAARRQATTSGLVRRESADDVMTVLRDTFDPRNGGFGEPPRFPAPEAVELLYCSARDDAAAATMADQTLDGMLSGELWDAPAGGFFRYALEADWTAPRQEKLLDVNAGLLDAYALGATVRQRDDWAAICDATVAWVDATLADRESGLWVGSQAADPDYFGASANARRDMTPPRADDTVYTAAVARWCAALANAGARLGREAWVERADVAYRTLLRSMATEAGRLAHYRVRAGPAQLDTLLIDTLEAARAALCLARATGSAEWLATGRQLARRLEHDFWADDGGFRDRIPAADDVGALRYSERPFEANALAAHVLLDLAQVTGERGWRALAERTLSRLGPVAARYGPAAAVFALATSAFYEPPPAIVIAMPVGAAHDDGTALRSAAARLPIAGLRVWTVTDGHSVGPQRFTANGAPTAWLWTRRGCSAPVTEPARLLQISRDAGLDA